MGEEWKINGEYSKCTYNQGKKSGPNNTLLFLDQSKYEGDLDDNEMSGQGTMTWPDGRKY
jgi:hypothetical protein